MPRNMTRDTVLREADQSQWVEQHSPSAKCPILVPHSHNPGLCAVVALFEGNTVPWQKGNDLRDGAVLVGKTLTRLTSKT